MGFGDISGSNIAKPCMSPDTLFAPRGNVCPDSTHTQKFDFRYCISRCYVSLLQMSRFLQKTSDAQATRKTGEVSNFCESSRFEEKMSFFCGIFCPNGVHINFPIRQYKLWRLLQKIIVYYKGKQMFIPHHRDLPRISPFSSMQHISNAPQIIWKLGGQPGLNFWLTSIFL